MHVDDFITKRDGLIKAHERGIVDGQTAVRGLCELFAQSQTSKGLEDDIVLAKALLKISDSPWCEEISVESKAAEEPQEPPQLPTDKVFVNVYSVSREYGGPEEGGWWYDHATPELCVPTTREHAEEIKARLCSDEAYAHQVDRYGRRVPLSSVLSRGEYQVYIEDRMPSETPRPHYC